jgi:hypothetical protein
LARVQTKADQFKWGEILTVNGMELLTSYANVTSEQVCQAAMVYQALNDHRVQNSNMLYNCLCKSISSNVHAKVTTNKARYCLVIPRAAPNDPVTYHCDGICFLKAIIDETYMNTLNNTIVARSNFTTLATYMKTLSDSNISEFNTYMKKNYKNWQQQTR